MEGSVELQEGRIGRVVAVSGSQVVVMLDSEDVSGLQMGELIKVQMANTTVYGLISALNIPLPATDTTDNEMRLIEMDLVGEIAHHDAPREGSFQRGVSVMPSLSDGVYRASTEDLGNVFAFAADYGVKVGTIYQDENIPALIDPDGLLGKHFAVLGTTGSGKSCAVALVLRSILSRYPEGHVLFLDMHNEYAHAFGDRAEVLDPARLELPYWLLTFEELEEIVAASGLEDREVVAGILSEAILVAKRAACSDAGLKERLTVDTPVPYRMGDLLRLVDEAVGKLDKGREASPYLRLKSRLQQLSSDPRYSFMFPGLSVSDKMAAILGRLFRVPVEGKPITIVDLSGVPSEILNVVVSVLCRMTFDFAMWSDREVPVMLVCEEAHRYAPQDSHLGFEPAKRALARIAKEGRKYGVSLCVVSQRPSELAVDVLSQCNTYFALRMSNQKDQDFMRGTLSESSIGLLDSLPSLRNGEAIAVGEGVSLPVRVRFEELGEEDRPRSGTAGFTTAWSQDSGDTGFLGKVVARWRNQGR